MSRSMLPVSLCVIALVFTCCIQVSLCVLNETCSTPPDTCSVTNSICNSITSMCQCADTFYSGNTAECLPILNLKVMGLQSKSSTISSLTLQWTEPTDRSAVSNYLVSWTGNPSGNAIANVGTSEMQITDLLPGSIYTVNVTTQITHLGQSVTSPAVFVGTKKALNQSCSNTIECGTTNAACLVYSGSGYTKICQCTATFYPLNNECKKKKGLEEQCSATIECGSVYGECLEYRGSNNLKTCQCTSGYYYRNKQCKRVENLKVTGIEQKSSTVTSVTVQWTEPSDVGDVFTYIVSWSSTDGASGNVTVNVGNTEKEIAGLQPGSVYTVTVTTQATHLGQTTAPSSIVVRTKKALDQSCTSSLECGTVNTACLVYSGSAGLKKCQCVYGFYPLGGLCQHKKALDEACTDMIECGTTNADCLEYTGSGGVKTCQCSEGYYPRSDQCKQIVNLKVTGLNQKSSTLKSVTVQWTEPRDSSAVLSYVVSWRARTERASGKLNVNVGNTEIQIVVPYPGTLYSVTVTTLIAHLGQSVITDIAVVGTKKALSQPCNDPSECGTSNAACLVVSESSGWKKCLCRPGYYPTNGICREKKALEQSCLTSIECGTTHAGCLEYDGSGGLKKCQCSETYYLQNKVCKQIKNLKVTQLRQNSSTLSSVKVQWLEPTDLVAVSSYVVSWGGRYSGKTAVTVGTTEKQIIGLTPGTVYAVTVTTQVTHLGQTIAPAAVEARTKTAYNATCTDGSLCLDPKASCSTMEPRRCLCVTNYFWNSTKCLLAPVLTAGSVVRKPSDQTLFEDRFAMVVCASCLYKPTTGRVTLAGLIVYRETVYRAARRRKRELRYEDYYNNYTNWNASSLTGFEIPYRATNDSWINEDSDLERYVIGLVNCSLRTQENVTFCNGPLPRATDFIVVLFACTNDGCRESDGAQFSTKPDDVNKGENSAIIGVSVLAVIFFILMVILAGILFWFVRRAKLNSESPSKNNDSAAKHEEVYEVVDDVNGQSKLGADKAQKNRKKMPPIPMHQYEKLDGRAPKIPKKT
ncbi:uncharacterized protein LOC121371845 [Gigantopelta aegis]|uniref:uncharacterized protein LOC121371845 n=1 Tax=Gigantopelta aegis TaxID=1735272 RepID=UPI001B889B39|nr:uncharacterized protein LOC121371845 [Gigantopelta aegis]